jgi:uncharacterized protein (DUF952 family)
MVIAHLVRATYYEQFENRNYYESETLHEEGFMHCCGIDQINEIKERYFRGMERVIVLLIDASRVRVEIKYEPGFGNVLFPHIYGPLHKDAVLEVLRLSD